MESDVSVPAWAGEIDDKVRSVVFANSFADARPRSTNRWFSRMKNLESIVEIKNLNTSNVVTMGRMFYNCSSLKSLDLSTFNTANVINMWCMFYGCSGLESLNVSSFDTKKVTDMSYMFDNCGGLTSLDLSSFRTDSVKDMTYMFSACDHLTTLNIENFRAPKVRNMSFMFNGCQELTSVDVSKLKTDSVTNMYRMFAACYKLTSLDLSSFNTSNVTDMKEMFYNDWALTTIRVSDLWSTASVIYQENMFGNCSKIKGSRGTTYDDNHTGFEYARIDYAPDSPGYLSVDSIAYTTYTADNTTLTFYCDDMWPIRQGSSHKLVGGTPGWRSDGSHRNVTTVVFDESFSNARPTTAYYWFADMTNLTTITGMEYLNTSEMTEMTGMFSGCTNLTAIDLSHFDTGNVTLMSSMFYNCTGLTVLNLSSFNTAKVEWMNYVFRGCTNLTTIYVSDKWSTASATESTRMFFGCTKIKGGKGTTYNASATDKTYAHIDLGTGNPGYFTASRTVPIAYVEYDASTQTLSFKYDSRMSSRTGTLYLLNEGANSPGWYSDGTYQDVKSVTFYSSFDDARPTSTHAWFDNMHNLTGITFLNYLNTSEVTDMAYMFSNCSALTSLNLSTLNTEKVVDMSGMFLYCPALTSLNLTGFNTSNVTQMSQMFQSCKNLTTLDLTNFNTSNVQYMNQMFRNCSNLKTIIVGDDWSTDAVIWSSDMFTDCTSLEGSNGTVYSAEHTDAAYAHADGGEANPGYLTNLFDINYFKYEGIWYQRYNTSTKEARVVAPQRGDNYSGEVIIPNQVEVEGVTWRVTSLDTCAFSGTDVTRVDVPSSISNIPSKAFYGAQSLKKLVILYPYNPNYIIIADDFAGNNASGFTCYVVNPFLSRYEEKFPTVKFAPWLSFNSNDIYTPYKPFSSKYYVFIPEGVEAYYVKNFNQASRIAKTEEITGTIPANEGLLLHSSEARYYLFERSANQPAEITTNYLCPYLSTEDSPLNRQDDYTYLYFKTDDYTWTTTVSLQMGGSYLQILTSVLGDDVTSPILLDLEYTDEGLFGDLNDDGSVNAGDVSKLYKALLNGLTDSLYDFSGDGNVNVGDVGTLYKIILGK